MPFASLSLLGLHSANPPSVHQQLSRWSPGTPTALTTDFQRTQYRSKITQLCPLKRYFRENL